MEKACKPRASGAAAHKGKPPTIATLLRVVSSLVAGLGAQEQGEGESSRGGMGTLSLVDTLGLLFQEGGPAIKDWEFIAS